MLKKRKKEIKNHNLIHARTPSKAKAVTTHRLQTLITGCFEMDKTKKLKLNKHLGKPATKKLVIMSVCCFTQTSHWPSHVSAQTWKSA